MASYRIRCRHCDTLIDIDSRFCPICGSKSPFVFLCPNCRRVVNRKDMICSNCGRFLFTTCPTCGKDTFTGERCMICGASLLKKCSNPLCGERQFYENMKCTVCGEKI